MPRRVLLLLVIAWAVAGLASAHTAANDTTTTTTTTTTTIATTNTTQCPSQVDALLASERFTECRRDVAEIRAISRTWFFNVADTDSIHSSEACVTVLFHLQAVAFDVCETSLTATDGSAFRVSIEKEVLAEVARPCRRRRLRQQIVRAARSLADGTTTTYDYTWLYVGIAVSVGLFLLSCAVNAYRQRNIPKEERGQSTCVLCFCIPIPLCC